jgi:hypothetical protein
VGYDISLHIKISGPDHWHASAAFFQLACSRCIISIHNCVHVSAEIKDKEAAVQKLQLCKSVITGSIFRYFFQALVDGKVRLGSPFAAHAATCCIAAAAS